MENSGPTYQQLLGRVREVMPEVATQVEEEVARGQRLTAETLPEGDRDTRSARMKDAGSRMSKEDLIWAPYNNDQRLQLLVDAVLRVASTMATSRAAIAELLRRNERATTVRFVDEELPLPPSEVDVGREAPQARAALAVIRPRLEEAHEELK